MGGGPELFSSLPDVRWLPLLSPAEGEVAYLIEATGPRGQEATGPRLVMMLKVHLLSASLSLLPTGLGRASHSGRTGQTSLSRPPSPPRPSFSQSQFPAGPLTGLVSEARFKPNPGISF